MKYILFIIILLASIAMLEAQSISKQVIGNCGSPFVSSNHRINFTAGESIVGHTQNAQTVNQGFWAKLFENQTLEIEEPVEALDNILVFPNPVVNVLQIKFNKYQPEDFDIQFFDLNGKQIFNLDQTLTGQTTQLNISHLTDGIYLLRVVGKISNHNQSFKIIKH